jgi:hypothetical protein
MSFRPLSPPVSPDTCALVTVHFPRADHEVRAHWFATPPPYVWRRCNDHQLQDFLILEDGEYRVSKVREFKEALDVLSDMEIRLHQPNWVSRGTLPEAAPHFQTYTFLTPPSSQLHIVVHEF